MNTVFKIVLLVVLAGALAAITFANKGPSVDLKSRAQGESRRVKAAVVQKTDPVRRIRFSGETRAVNRAKLSFTLGERIVSRPVEVGDHVEAGQVLARLEDGKITHLVAESDASLREILAKIIQINRDHKRYESLVAASASAAVQLEKITENRAVLLAAKTAAEARLAEAQRMLKETVLRAPFPATVTEVYLEPGEFAAPGSPVVVLSGDGPVEIEVEVPEYLVSRLAVGQSVQVHFPMSGHKQVKGTIAYLGRTALGKGRLFPVQVALGSERDVAAGMTVEVIFSAKSQAVLCVPLCSIVNPGGQAPELFKIENGAVHKISVEIGPILGDRVAVKGDVRAGDLVVSGGHLALLDGERITVVKDEYR